jgi:hypothetical protein
MTIVSVLSPISIISFYPENGGSNLSLILVPYYYTTRGHVPEGMNINVTNLDVPMDSDNTFQM